jgi:hypothetical protein
MRSVTVIGWTMLIFGIVLYWADQKGPQTETRRRLDPARRDRHGPLAGGGADPGHVAVGHHHHGGRMLGYDRESRGTARHADVDPDDPRLGGAVLGAARSSPTPTRRPPATAPSRRHGLRRGVARAGS